MRYDIVTKDALVPPFSHRPDTPATRDTPVFIHGEQEDELEDTVVPLLPGSDPWNDPDYIPESGPPPLRGRTRVRLDEIAKMRGLVVDKGRFKGQVNLSAITRGTGLAYATVYKILRTPDDLTSISFIVLTRLCEFLHCAPGDLIVWEPRSEEPQTQISDYYTRKTQREGTNGNHV